MPLFGRAAPLATANQALEDATSGRGGALVVMGEPGIGKSALARALATQAEDRGARVGFGRAWEVGGAPTYWPWTQALGELGLDLDELLGSASGEMGGAQRLVAFERVVRAVSTSEGGPVVVILDDLHAADVASLELALAFARAAQRKKVLLVVTTRESELLERREIGDLVGKLAREGRAIPLRRLDADATASWLSSVGFDGDATEVHRLSEGNPLFIEEAVRLGVDRFASAAAGGVPVILAEHLARISEKTRETLAIASVFGREASYADVAALADSTIDEIEAIARDGQSAGVLSPTKRASLVFSHVLLRDTLYETLASSRRASLHARAADLVEAEGGAPSIVAEHLLAAGDGVDAERVVRTVCNAAEAAAARHAADSAIELIANARRRLARRMGESTALTLDLAEVDAIMRSKPSDEARARAADCAARAKRLGLPIAHARAALTYGREILAGRVDAAMVSILESALAEIPQEERALRAMLLARLGAAMAPPTDPELNRRTVAYAREAISIARELGHVPTLLYALQWGHNALIYNIPIDERVELMRELVSLAREHGADITLANGGNYLSAYLLEAGRPAAARYEAEAYCRHVEALPIPALRWKATALRATMAALDGRLDEARRLSDELQASVSISQQARAAWTCFEIFLCAATNDVERLREREEEISKLTSAAVFLSTFQACVEAMLGRPDAAVDCLHRLKPPHALQNLGLFVKAQAIVSLGSSEEAEKLYDELASKAPLGRLFFGPTGVFPLGPLSRYLGELALLRGDRERAREHFETAVAETREMGAVPLIALCEQGLARAGGAAPRVEAVAKKSPEVSFSLAREGDVWVVTSSTSAAFRVKHAKGYEYLDHLLQNPGREVYVLALGGAGEGPEDGGAILDEKAKRAYKERVEDLEDELAEAERLGDRGRATRAREELETVAEQLASAVGLGGRDRKAASNVERARVNVQRRIKDAIRRIGEHDAALGRYLDATVRTGTYCVYRPV